MCATQCRACGSSITGKPQITWDATDASTKCYWVFKREAIGRAGLGAAFHALPVPGTSLARVHVVAAAARATDSIGPALDEKAGVACLFVGKKRVKLGKRHLRNEFRLGFSGHEEEISGS